MCTKSEVQEDVTEPQDARVWPKALVDAAVNASVATLLKTSVAESEDPTLPELNIIKKKKKSVKIIKSNEINDLKQILYALGILGIIILGFLYTLFERVSSLEVWLHGRLGTLH